MQRWLSIFDPLGKVLAIYACSMFVPATVGMLRGEPVFVLGEGGVDKYFIAGTLVLALGLLLARIGRGHAHYLQARQAFMLVLLIWIFLPMIGAIPLYDFTVSFSQAYFEAVSGMTASGATVLSDIDSLPTSAMLWRGLISWMGGMGLIVLAVAILPHLGVGGRQLFKNEMPGPIKEQELSPQIAETAKGLWLVYFGLTLACAFCYWLGGMTLLDAVVHACTTLSLGGFSNHDASFAYFDSPLIEGIAVFFMIVAGMNFATHYSFARAAKSRIPGRSSGRWPGAPRVRRMFAVYQSDFECKAYLTTLLAGIAVVILVLTVASHYPDIGSTIRYAIFNTVSIATTTGYSSADFGAWPLAAPLFILLLANFTSCGGSTGGGVKMMRAITVVKVAQFEQIKLLHSHASQNIKIGQRILPDSIVASILFFLLAYVASIIAFTLLFVLTEPQFAGDLLTPFSAAAALISNTGPGLGAVGPAATYGGLSEAGTWLGALAMLLGRLELLLFLLLFRREMWS